MLLQSLRILSAGNALFLFCSLLTWSVLPPCTRPALAQKPSAADLVQDGQPIDLTQEKYRALFAELEQQHQFTASDLREIFTGQTINRRILVLMDKQWEAKPYYQYYPLFVTRKIINTGKKKLQQHKELLDRVEARFGVDRETIIAIWAIETRFGSNQGSYNVLQTLNTLFDAYPRRSKFFRSELIAFLLLCRENQVDPASVKGSYAGAFGQTQFIPSSFINYAVSFDGDDRSDVWNSVPDVLASIANYLKQFEWTLGGPIYVDIGHDLHDPRLVAAKLKGRKETLPLEVIARAQKITMPPSPGNRPLTIVGLELSPSHKHSMRYVAGYRNFQAITEWNHSNRYAMVVAELAESLAR